MSNEHSHPYPIPESPWREIIVVLAREVLRLRAELELDAEIQRLSDASPLRTEWDKARRYAMKW